MGKDRLKELQERANIVPEDEGTQVSSPIEPGNGPVTIQIEMLQKAHEMERFLKKAEEIRDLNFDLRQKINSVNIIHTDMLSKFNPGDEDTKALDDLTLRIKQSSQIIKGKLTEMERDIKRELEESESEQITANLRMQRTQYRALLKEFLDLMNDYQSGQMDYRDRCKGRIRSQLNIAGASYSEDDVENMIEDGNFSIFTDSVMIEAELAKRTLAAVESRHNDILKLEKSLRELGDLFTEMAMLVESQGEMIDRIETHVTTTQAYSENAVVQLKQAQALQTSARKKMICIIITVIILLIILGLVIYFSVK